jgi:small conductance mechanosensitive channel
MSWDDLFSHVPFLVTLIEVVIVVAVAIILERILTRYLRRFVKRTGLPPGVGNGLALFTRLLILLGAIIAFLAIGGFPAEWIVTFSALGGVAVGFASSRTVGNFISGLFVLVVRPFRVHDYVRIGNVEGVVEEITINYTKIKTQSDTIVLISNQRTLDQDIVNYRYEESKTLLYCYNVELAFDYSIPTEKLEKIFDNIIEKYEKTLPKKPWYVMLRITSFAKHYMFYIYVENSKDIFTLPPKFVKDVTASFEKART